ncbi:MAG: hypothetical protein K2P70_09680 [Hyphomonadaceae bacterium]|nr:hypothetical protein [Hyphomonadaceae bacterium]
MTATQLFVGYWWLIFPIFGMLMGLIGMFQSDRRATRTMDLIKAYVDQGKDPPPELLQLAAAESTSGASSGMGRTPTENRLWTFVTFAALATGFGVGYWFMRAEEWAFAFLVVAIVMGIMAFGALLLLIFGRKS